MAVSMNRPRARAIAGALVLGTGVALLASATAPEVASAGSAPGAAAVPLPPPKDLVSGLDLECYDTPGPAMNRQITLTHLNPVLLQLGFPAHNGIIRELQQTCVPVMKNGVSPPPSAQPFIEHIDFACYRLETPALTTPIPLTLNHLNPVLAGLPQHQLQMVGAVQLCLPVGKNGVKPPDDILRLVQYIDLECWRTNPGPHPNFGVSLRQLNPQLQNIPPHDMALTATPRQMCVPVRKNQQVIPTDVLSIVRWIDLEKFTAGPVTIPATPVSLHHLNPLFLTAPREQVTLQTANSLMVPVAKNNTYPP